MNSFALLKYQSYLAVTLVLWSTLWCHPFWYHPCPSSEILDLDKMLHKEAAFGLAYVPEH